MVYKSTTRVLIVDDNADMRLSIKLLLERAGYEVGTAPTGNRAFELQRQAPCDVLITDIFMPDVDGLETIARFKREFPSVRIIAISGGTKNIMGGKYLSLANIVGADVSLLKPFETTALLEVLRGLTSAKSGTIDP